MVTEMSNTGNVKQLEKQLKNERVVNAITMQAASRVLNRNLFARLKDIATGKSDEAKPAEVVEEKASKTKPAAKKAAKAKTPPEAETAEQAAPETGEPKE